MTNDKMSEDESDGMEPTLKFTHTVTRKTAGSYTTEDVVGLEVPMYEVKDLLEQSMRGTLDGVDNRTIRKELEARSINAE